MHLVTIRLLSMLALTTPGWITYGAAVLGFVVALGTAWKTVLNPMRKFANKAEAMFPLLVDLTDTFQDTPHAFAVLDEIIAQFRTDSGSSLRDVINRLEGMADENAKQAERNTAAATALAVGVEAARQLDERDREELSRLLIQQDRQAAKLDAALAALEVLQGGQRGMRDAAAVVASNLAVAQTAVDHVAQEAAASHARADAVVGGVPGEAADAGAQSNPKDAS